MRYVKKYSAQKRKSHKKKKRKMNIKTKLVNNFFLKINHVFFLHVYAMVTMKTSRTNHHNIYIRESQSRSLLSHLLSINSRDSKIKAFTSPHKMIFHSKKTYFDLWKPWEFIPSWIRCCFRFLHFAGRQVGVVFTRRFSYAFVFTVTRIFHLLWKFIHN
jgi:hypothetical protein